MDGRKTLRRGANGRFVAGPRSRTELKRGRGDKGKGRPQIRSMHKRALTDREIGTFLTALGETCNVAQAARESGRPSRNFYDLKRRDCGFRAAWAEALGEGYDRLELEMVRRARFGTRRSVFFRGRKTATTRILNDSTALRLLALHRKSIEAQRAADRGPSIDAEAIFDALAARLAEIEAEEAAKARKSDDGEA